MSRWRKIARLPISALTQFFGTQARLEDEDWKRGSFVLNGQALDYYDYVRAVLGGGRLRFDPLREVADMVTSKLRRSGLSRRRRGLGPADGPAKQPQPGQLPPTSMARRATGRPIPHPRATPASRPPSRRCATARNVSLPCGAGAIRARPMRGAIWRARCLVCTIAPPPLQHQLCPQRWQPGVVRL